MTPELVAAIASAEGEVAELTKRLQRARTMLDDLLRRAREASLSLPIARQRLDDERKRRPDLEVRLIQAKADRAERERQAAESAADCGCC